jgi:hypothetical protein
MHIIAALAGGAWSGQEDTVAFWVGTGWIFMTPKVGWRAWVTAEAAELVWHAGAWQSLSGVVASFDNLTGVGGNAAEDAANRLSVSSPASLFNHEGGGHQLKIKTAVTTDTASLVFQSEFPGCAEMGLAGDDAFSIKVSGDGLDGCDELRSS